MMQFSNRHIATLGRLLLVLFLLANAGFTLVLQQCSMQGSSENMACCDDQNPAAAGACANMDLGQAGHATLAAGNAGCMAMKVVGGLQNDPKFVEKESTGAHLVKIYVLPVSAISFSNSPNADRPFCLTSSAVSRISPLSVEKYVLTASFLI